MTPTIDMLLRAALAEPAEAGPRAALADEMQEVGCWGREPILKWVRAFRADDAPRLLYADWCEMRGEGNPDARPLVRKLLVREWPGIEFTLPAPDYAEMNNEMREDILNAIRGAYTVPPG